MSRADPVQRAGLAAAGSMIRLRALEIVREISEAFLTATQALEVYRLALQRLTPLVNASFASIFLRDAGDPSLLKLECAHNWPQASARYLAELRLRVGRGPTGRAVSERHVIEVENIFSDPAMREWWEPARELGFTALIALPLGAGDEAAGAISFYYDVTHRFTAEERHVLALFAAQLAAMTNRAHCFEQLNAAHEQLARARASFVEQIGGELLADVSRELQAPLTAILGHSALLADGTLGALAAEQAQVVTKIDRTARTVLQHIDDLVELTQVRLGRVPVASLETDAILLARHAAARAGTPPAGVRFDVVPEESRVTIVADAAKVVRILCHLLDHASRHTTRGSIELLVRRRTEPASGSWVEWEVRDSGIGSAEAARSVSFDASPQADGSPARLYGGAGAAMELCHRLAELLGGTIGTRSEPGDGSAVTLRLPLHPSPPA